MLRSPSFFKKFKDFKRTSPAIAHEGKPIDSTGSRFARVSVVETQVPGDFNDYRLEYLLEANVPLKPMVNFSEPSIDDLSDVADLLNSEIINTTTSDTSKTSTSDTSKTSTSDTLKTSTSN